MAELRIRKKRPVWPWIVIGLVLLTIVIYLLANNFLEGEKLESGLINTPAAFQQIEARLGTDLLRDVSVPFHG